MFYLLNYKSEMKENAILCRIKILKPLLLKTINQKELAKKLNIHYNTINNIVRIFKNNNSSWDKDIIINSSKYDFNFLQKRFSYLDLESRAPLSHSRSIKNDSYIWKKILKIQKDTNKGYMSVNNILKTHIWFEKYNNNEVTISKIRWFFKRNNLKCKKIKTANREYRSPFDFQNTMAFSFLYTDIKHIPDKHALPIEIYNKFKYWVDSDWVIIKGFPKYELNVIEQNTRIRFIAYLTEIDSHLIMNFIEYVIQFIRWNNFLAPHIKITIWMDGWTDFLSNSLVKLEKYNKQIKYLNAEYYFYDWPKDTRKNLIERSHLSDDLEFFIPRWYSINSKKSFLTEAKKYQEYWNFHRQHTWRYMDNLTPIQKALKLWIYNIWIMSIFPTVILQDFYREISVINHSSEFLEKSQYVFTKDQNIFYIFLFFINCISHPIYKF